MMNNNINSKYHDGSCSYPSIYQNNLHPSPLPLHFSLGHMPLTQQIQLNCDDNHKNKNICISTKSSPQFKKEKKETNISISSQSLTKRNKKTNVQTLPVITSQTNNPSYKKILFILQMKLYKAHPRLKQNYRYSNTYSSDYSNIQTATSHHPLVTNIPINHIQHIQSAFILAQRIPNDCIMLNSGCTHPFLTYQSFLHLLQYGQMTDDSILQSFLHSLRRSHPQTFYLNTNFHRVLSQQGWDSAYNTFFLHNDSSRYAKRTTSKPSIDTDTILIPIHIHGCHWVALARKKICQDTYFLYADDLNSPNTYDTVRTTYSSSTSPTFHPANSIWIKCHSYTYQPHSNEFGPRCLLALAIMATHSTHSSTMLPPYMDENIAQISRWWIADSILNDRVIIPTIPTDPQEEHDYISSLVKISNPSNLAPLNSNVNQSFPPTNDISVPEPSSKTLNSQDGPTYSSQHGDEQTGQYDSQCLPFSHGPLQNPSVDTCKINAKAKPKQYITNWTVHRPFIPGVNRNNDTTHNVHTQPNKVYDQHWRPFGTQLPIIDPTKTLRIVFQNPQHSFQLYDTGIDMSHTISNLISLGAQMFVSSSPNVNWNNQRNWRQTKQLF